MIAHKDLWLMFMHSIALDDNNYCTCCLSEQAKILPRLGIEVLLANQFERMLNAIELGEYAACSSA